MEGNERRREGPDNAPIRPVSSLLSHFEHLANAGGASRSSGNLNDGSSRRLKPPDDAEHPHAVTRASLDLPRPYSPWSSAKGALGESDQRQFASSGGSDATCANGSLGTRGRRPMSMMIRSSPQLAPVLTVASPRSPHGVDANLSDPRPSISRDISDIVSQPPSQRSPPRSFPRRTRPGSPPARSATMTPVELSVRGTSPIGMSKSASVPPPVNRADKPKVLLRQPNPRQGNGGSLQPTSEHTASDRISPFSTPPSSPEKSMGFNLEGERLPKFTKPASLSQPSNKPLFAQPATDVSPRGVPSAGRSADTGDQKPSWLRPVPEFSRGGAVVVGMTSEPQNVREVVSSGQKPPNNRNLEVPPSLPPRVGAREKPSHSSAASEHRIPSLSSIRGSSNPGSPSLNRAWTIDANTQFTSPRSAATAGSRFITGSPRVQSPRPPSFSRDSKFMNPTPTPSAPNPPSDDSEAEEILEETPVPRTDYPDSSQANRRPPVFKSELSTIATKYDTRVFDVCGKHVCTVGYLTRVWDLTTGEQVISLSHGETVKVLSVAFKPGSALEDEGSRLWLGTSIGELQEVDLRTRSIVTSRSYPSRREVTTIHRHKKEMWTIDDDGRLLLWLPDETGTPNLQYSYTNPQDRVARGHTFSIVVGDTLWLAVGKEVRVYRPNASGESFHVLKKPLGTSHTGEVTSGTHTTNGGGRVYLGQADGKVTVYSSIDYTCIASVNVSVYKIHCLAMVGDYLWAAYKTGMIYVYDVSTNPWTVKKDWHAHNSPVCGLLLDPSSVWTLNRLQVASLGTDNFIRLWDGMLEEDWLETRMQSRDVEYCSFREIRAAVLTWNAGASVPRDSQNNTFIQDVLHLENPPEILVFGFQELVDLENKRVNAKSLFMGNKKKAHHDNEHMSRQYRVWKDHLDSCINQIMPLGESYVLLHTANLVGLFTCVFVKHKEREKVRNVSSVEVKRGMGGLHGNKGALILRFVIDDSSICFVNCHLAAGQTQTAHRNNDIAAILESESLPAEASLTARADLFVGGGDGTMILDHEICVLNGDLNYRIDSMTRSSIIDAVRNNNLQKLLERDQLLASKRKNPGFRLRSFNEALITFAPTYKYDVGTDEYDSSEKKRSPAWCDRILYRGVGRIKQMEYRRHEVRASDHRPVSALFKMRVKTISPRARADAWGACQKEFLKEKRRLAREASIEYLVNVLGTDPQEARRLITSSPPQ